MPTPGPVWDGDNFKKIVLQKFGSYPKRMGKSGLTRLKLSCPV
jgi:hypothetical protein